jgi:hypothetical protein
VTGFVFSWLAIWLVSIARPDGGRAAA